VAEVTGSRSVRACDACLRRTWLLARLAGHLEHARHGGGTIGGRLRDVLALADEELVAALAGTARPAIGRELAAVRPADLRHAAVVAGLDAACRHDDAYPERLRDLGDAPAVLHVAGGLRRVGALVGGSLEDGARAVAVVGTRRASPDGDEVARALGRGLAAAGVTVVSGMAIGIDSAAHAGALEVGGRTLAVLGGGADRPSPAGRRALHRALVERGAVVSELPPGFAPFRWCFPARNRIIAALSALTVVVEAAERSGSLITADFAAALGRDVGAVPGSPLAWRSAGANDLLRDGAVVVRSAADVLDAVLGSGARLAPGAGPQRAASHRFAGLEPRLRHIIDAVGAGRDTVAALAAAPADVADVLAAVTELELLGLLRRAPGGRYVLTAP
jgi:DNA processing protein